MSATLEADRKRLRKAIEHLGAIKVHLRALIRTSRAPSLEGMADVLSTALWRALENPEAWSDADAASHSSTPRK